MARPLNFIRNSALDARNYLTAQRFLQFKREPVWRLCGRSSMERPHVHLSAITRECGKISVVTFGPNNVPSPAARQGILCSECFYGAGHGSCCPERSEISCLYSPTHRPPRFHGKYRFVLFRRRAGNKLRTFLLSAPTTSSVRQTLLHGTYLFDNGKTTGPTLSAAKLIGTFSKRQLATIEDTHVFNAVLLNSARFGFSRVVSKAPFDPECA